MSGNRKREQLKEVGKQYGKRKMVIGKQRTVKKAENRKQFSNFRIPYRFPISINRFPFPNFQTNFCFLLTNFKSYGK